MRLSDLSDADFNERLERRGLRIQTGPFSVCLKSRFPAVHDAVRQLYSEFPLGSDEFADFHVAVAPAGGARRILRNQAVFVFDGTRPFAPLPAAQAYPALEWGLNWCAATLDADHLVLHAAALARGAHGLVLPGAPGSGKSTLCAALAHRGWRLLSDELALIRRRDAKLAGLARPVSLKNASIGVISRFAPGASFSPRILDTTKGTVSHMQPPSASVRAVSQLATPRWLVLPKYRSGIGAALDPLSRGNAFMAAAECGFNYSRLRGEGFDLMADMIENCATYRLEYGDLPAAIKLLNGLEI